MENHHFSWENSLLNGHFRCVSHYQRVTLVVSEASQEGHGCHTMLYGSRQDGGAGRWKKPPCAGWGRAAGAGPFFYVDEVDSIIQYPLVMTNIAKMAIYSEFFHEKWWCSIAMLVYQRVSLDIRPWLQQPMISLIYIIVFFLWSLLISSLDVWQSVWNARTKKTVNKESAVGSNTYLKKKHILNTTPFLELVRYQPSKNPCFGVPVYSYSDFCFTEHLGCWEELL